MATLTSAFHLLVTDTNIQRSDRLHSLQIELVGA